MNRFTANRVKARLGHGSSSPVVVETDGGTFVTKLHGAGQGVAALVAEILVAELAERLALPVPDRVLIDLAKDTESDDRNDELRDLLRASVGENLGFRWLEGAREPRPADLDRLDDDFVARVLWLDGFVMNVDRTAENPNILLWNGQPWLIDHGAALPFQYDWDSVTEDSPREPTDFSRHLFADRAALLAKWDEKLARIVSRAALQSAVEEIPSAWLERLSPDDAAERIRARYHAFLWKRLKASRAWISPGPGLT